MSTVPAAPTDPECARLAEGRRWKLWGTYLSERQWATVREDYSADHNPWDAFPHDHARSRAYRWGEDGLLGFTDEQCRLCFAPALWNGRDPILKERLYGLAGPEGNHGEDVKELYYYLDATPTHSYAKALYKYPQAEFPYARLVEENRRRDRSQREFELLDTGIFDGERYFDLLVEYAKAAPDDILIRLTVINQGPEAATVHLLPTLWFRNTWSWGEIEEEVHERPAMNESEDGGGAIVATHAKLGRYRLQADPAPGEPERWFTENDSNAERLWGYGNDGSYVKDAFHEALIHGRHDRLNPRRAGTKGAFHFQLDLAAGATTTVRLRLRRDADGGAPQVAFGEGFDAMFSARIAEADAFYAGCIEPNLDAGRYHVARAAYAGLLWSKQFYNLVQSRWASGDPATPTPPPQHGGLNGGWQHLYARDVLSLPDKWEFPYLCSWDLGFHCVCLSRVDATLAKHQLKLLLREWYMHRNGALPAYEFAFSDVNPPVHPWAVWRVYRLPSPGETRDRAFLERCYQKLLLNFTWWVNREDADGGNLFSGGFLGLDNVGVFDRSKPLPNGGALQQADGTGWMAFYCIHMLSMSLELARTDEVYEDLASKFLEHFGAITQAINYAGGDGLWDEEDGFYYDQIRTPDGRGEPLRVRSIAGLIPLFATTIIKAESREQFKAFVHRAEWEHQTRPQQSQHVLEISEGHQDMLLTIPTRERLRRLLERLFDENEFLSPHGIRSLSKVHEHAPYTYWANGQPYTVNYDPGESTSTMFGGNSNWRGPIWMPVNYLILESLRIYHRFFGDSFRIEYPTGSGQLHTLGEAALDIAQRLQSLFLPGADGHRPCHGGEPRYAYAPAWKDLLLFNEYFHGDDGRGCGASHQTGWTALVADLMNLESHWRSTHGEN